MIPDLIFDVGMHDGSDSAFYLSKGFRVVAIEANPHLCEAARQRFSAAIQAGRMHIVSEGVADTCGVLKFGINKSKDDWSSFVPGFAERGSELEYVDVQVRPLDHYIETYGVPYYCKIDVEGHDDMCIQGLERCKEFPKYVSTEATVANFSKRMSALGYRHFKIISQLLHQSLEMPFPPKEGRYVNCRTNGFMSGAFGDETYGPWLSAEDLEKEYDMCTRKEYEGSLHARMGCPREIFMSSWYDFHARLS